MVLAPDATGGEVSAPARRKLPHYPGLDGVRGLAALGVLFFHGGFEWARGGYLGVSLFFTLSGFLITRLLLDGYAHAGRVDFREVLGWAAPPARARAARDARSGDRPRTVRVGCQPTGCARRRRRELARLRRQLAVPVLGALVRRPVQRTVAAAALLVDRGRGAVLPGVPGDRGGHAQARATARAGSCVASWSCSPGSRWCCRSCSRTTTASTTAPTPARSRSSPAACSRSRSSAPAGPRVHASPPDSVWSRWSRRSPCGRPSARPRTGSTAAGSRSSRW